MTTGISVVIPTYNRDKLLGRCIDSVLHTIGESDEIVVVDGGTTGKTESVIDSYNDVRIRYIYHENEGVSAARNVGMEVAKNDLIAFIDDDDEWHPSKLKIQRALLEIHPDAVACFTNLSATDSQGNQIPNYLFKWGQPIQDWNQLLGETHQLTLEGDFEKIDYYFGEHYFNQMLDDYILPSSLLIDRAKFKDQLTFRVGMQRNESWLFSSQVCRQGPVIYVDYDLACQHGDADIRLTAISELDTILSRIYVLEKEFGAQDDFLRQHKREYDERLAREVAPLFRRTILSTSPNRKQIFADHAHHGAGLAVAAKLPEWALTMSSSVLRAARSGIRAIREF
jgi:glycosyltransferase involved in cell wall biosynthesis